MELREFAEQVLFATLLEEKLSCPNEIVDEHPGQALLAPTTPGRPPELRFKPHGTDGAQFPGLHHLDQEEHRGRLLHFFANHELLATELMALALLRFPDAPASFRRGVLQTLKDEQIHTRLYIERMRACGIPFGALPVNGYFWRCLSGMSNPIHYVAGLSLTFEQANLDYAQFFASGFEEVGDAATAQLLSRIYHDEIRHVAYGLKWFRRWKDPSLSDWQAFSRVLKFPLSPQRAKGPMLNAEGRRAAGLDPEFIAELNVYSQSRGRTPGVFVFNPLAEGYIAYGAAFTPKRHQALLVRDLANLPQFLCRQDDVVLVPQRPSVAFLSAIKDAGFPLPEFVEFGEASIGSDSPLRQRKLGSFRPWAWGPDSVALFEPLQGNLNATGAPSSPLFEARTACLYSKVWSAQFLRDLLPRWKNVPWLCPLEEVGIAAGNLDASREAVAKIRQRGHHRIVIKQAYGLAGQNSIRLWEPELLETQLTWLRRAFGDGRQVVVEPWLERVADFSIQLEMSPGSLKLLGYTGLVNDLKGQFKANWAAADFALRLPAAVTQFLREQPGFALQVRQILDDLRAILETELKRLGYAGPVGIDAFIYRTAEGHCRLKPVVEINPRYTMGRLTVELMKRVCPGCCGVFQIVNQSTARAAGFSTLQEYALAQGAKAPLRFEGEPVAKIREGFVCLNDPDRARVGLAVFKVGRNLEGLIAEALSRPMEAGARMGG